MWLHRQYVKNIKLCSEVHFASTRLQYSLRFYWALLRVWLKKFCTLLPPTKILYETLITPVL